MSNATGQTAETDTLRYGMTLCGVLAPLVAFTAILVAAWIHSDWFTWTGHALSDLGHVDREFFWVFNVGLLVTGTLGVVFSLRLLDYLDSTVSRIGAGLFLLGIFCLGLVGAFPLGVDYHSLVTFAFFTLCTLGVFVVGLGESLRGEPLGYGWLALVVAGVGLVILTLRWFDGAAIPELVGTVAYAIFAVGYAGHIRGRW
ncbi:hypothetical protein BRC65_04935 [Halobacteriales archaeon QH_2_65_14]|nr:MAG: hypothetical protein BRC65_04935 [Halobacteriales archaeon QH_2_65_14]